ncbi:MAG: OB-fold nucleic acid binding domain-containing protein [archaeon]
MNEKTLLRVSLFSAIAGIIALFVMSEMTEYPVADLSDIDISLLGRSVRTRGIVSGIIESEKTMIIELSGQGKTIGVFLFKDGPTTIPIGSQIDVTGEITEYNGRPEIIAEEIRVYSPSNSTSANTF